MSKPSIISYAIGFVGSLALTIIAFELVTKHLLTNRSLAVGLFALAFAQALIQLYFFLHIGSESKPRLNFWAFISTAGVVFIIVVASIWIMNNLNYNHMNDADSYIQHQEGIYK